MTKEISRKVQLKLQAALINTTPQKVFGRFDKDRRGTLDQAEFKKCVRMALRLPHSQVSDAEILLLCQTLDRSGDGELEIQEIVNFIERGLAAFDVPNSLTPESPGPQAVKAEEKCKLEKISEAHDEKANDLLVQRLREEIERLRRQQADARERMAQRMHAALSMSPEEQDEQRAARKRLERQLQNAQVALGSQVHTIRATAKDEIYQERLDPRTREIMEHRLQEAQGEAHERNARLRLSLVRSHRHSPMTSPACSPSPIRPSSSASSHETEEFHRSASALSVLHSSSSSYDTLERAHSLRAAQDSPVPIQSPVSHKPEDVSLPYSPVPSPGHVRPSPQDVDQLL